LVAEADAKGITNAFLQIWEIIKRSLALANAMGEGELNEAGVRSKQ
jgi:hypothetical protein